MLEPFEERLPKGLTRRRRSRRELRKRLGGSHGGRVVIVIPPPPVRGLGTAGGFRCMVEDRGGLGDRALEEAADELLTAAPRQHARLARDRVLATSRRAPQLFVDVDRDKAEMLGVPCSDVFDTLQTYLGSLYVNDFNRFGRTWQVTAQADAGSAGRSERLGQLKTRNAGARWCRSARRRRSRDVDGPRPRAALQHVSGRRHHTANLARRQLRPGDRRDGAPGRRDAAARHGLRMDRADLPADARAATPALLVFPLCVLFVFLVLAAQYESWTLPLAVILIVPMCLLAAIVGVSMLGQDNNIFTQIGLVVLVGLASKNAILIVEFAQQHRARGQAAPRRGDRGLPPAAAADPDDVVRVHPRRAAAGDRHRRRRGDAPGARRRGVLRHARRDAVRADLHAGLLRAVRKLAEGKNEGKPTQTTAAAAE